MTSRSNKPNITIPDVRIIPGRELVESPSAMDMYTPRNPLTPHSVLSAHSPRSPTNLEVPPMTEAMEDADLEPMLRSFAERREQELNQAGEDDDEGIMFTMDPVIAGDSSGNTSTQAVVDGGEADRVEENILPSSGRGRRLFRHDANRLRDNDGSQGQYTAIHPRDFSSSWAPGTSSTYPQDDDGYDSGYESSNSGDAVEGLIGRAAETQRPPARPLRRTRNFISPPTTTTATTAAAVTSHFYRSDTRQEYPHGPDDFVPYPLSHSQNPDAPVFPDVGFDARERVSQNDEDIYGADEGQTSARLSSPGIQAFTIEAEDDDAVSAAALLASSLNFRRGPSPAIASGPTVGHGAVPQNENNYFTAPSPASPQPPARSPAGRQPMGLPPSISALPMAVTERPAHRIRFPSPLPSRPHDRYRQLDYHEEYRNRRRYYQDNEEWPEASCFPPSMQMGPSMGPSMGPNMGPGIGPINIALSLSLDPASLVQYTDLSGFGGGYDQRAYNNHHRNDYPREPRHCRDFRDPREARHPRRLEPPSDYEVPDDLLVAEILSRGLFDRVVAELGHAASEHERMGPMPVDSNDSNHSRPPQRRDTVDSTSSFNTCSTCSVLVPNPRYRGWHCEPSPPPPYGEEVDDERRRRSHRRR